MRQIDIKTDRQIQKENTTDYSVGVLEVVERVFSTLGLSPAEAELVRDPDGLDHEELFRDLPLGCLPPDAAQVGGVVQEVGHQTAGLDVEGASVQLSRLRHTKG